MTFTSFPDVYKHRRKYGIDYPHNLVVIRTMFLLRVYRLTKTLHDVADHSASAVPGNVYAGFASAAKHRQHISVVCVVVVVVFQIYKLPVLAGSLQGRRKQPTN